MQQPGKTIELPSGKKLSVDLNSVTRKEWRSLYDFSQPEQEGNAIMAKILGLTIDELDEMGAADFTVATQSVYRCMEELGKEARKLDDPKA